MIYEYSAEAHRMETPFSVEERFLFRIPLRMVRKGDLVSVTPFGRQHRVRWAWFFRLTFIPAEPDAEVYVDASETRGARRQEEVDIP